MDDGTSPSKAHNSLRTQWVVDPNDTMLHLWLEQLD